MRHTQICQDEAVRGARNFLHRSARVRALGDAVARVLQRQAEHAPETVFVFNEKNVRHDEKQESESRSQEPEEKAETALGSPFILTPDSWLLNSAFSSFIVALDVSRGWFGEAKKKARCFGQRAPNSWDLKSWISCLSSSRTWLSCLRLSGASGSCFQPL